MIAMTEWPTTVTMTTTAEGGGTLTIVLGAEALPGTTMEEEAGREEGKQIVMSMLVTSKKYRGSLGFVFPICFVLGFFFCY